MRQAVLAFAADAIDQMISAVRAGDTAEPHSSTSSTGSEPYPADMAPALNDFVGIAATTAAECVADEPERLASGIRALHTAVCRQVTQTAASGRHLAAGELREERRRMARALHDGLGADINVAHRHLELYELLRDLDPDRAYRRVVSARQTLAAVMGEVRQLASELRLSETFNGLEQGLREFFSLVESDAIVPELVVTGDEAHFPPTVRYEIYLIIREAARNALVHSKGRSLSIEVDTRPDRLRAVVRDDGIGLAAGVSLTRGTGMASMNERVCLLGGSIHIEGTPGNGTTVEILVPAKL